MQVLRIIDLPTCVPLGVYTGQSGQQAVLDRLNATWQNSGSGVIFGQDCWGDRYKAFTDLITNRDKEVIKAVERTIEVTFRPDKIQEIFSLEDLKEVPPCMFIPILTMPNMRSLFEEGKLDGWGIKSQDLPDEDIAGRLLNNGTFCTGDEGYTRDSLVSFTIQTGDPDYTFDELSILRSSREWISEELERQLGEDGDNMDLTDIPNRMGKIRKIKQTK